MSLNPFLKESRRALPRLLSSLNRNEFSPMYGSFDRAYWHYRTVTAFESATFCQGVLSLALAYKHPIFGSGYEAHPEELKRHIEAALLHWTTLQHDDGSFDEWYPFERSHVATAFTSYAVAETLLLLRGELDGQVQKKVVDALHQSALWLSDHFDDKVLNHTAGAIPALHTAHRLTGDERLKAGLDRNLELMAVTQSNEGWFLENGGFDAGYLSLSLHYLRRYYESTEDERALQMITRGFSFLKLLVHPDGSSGGEYTSRNTKYLMPYGIIAAARDLEDARIVRDHLLKALEHGTAVTPSSTDDRYMIFFYLPNFMQAAVAYDQPSAPAIESGAVTACAHAPAAGLVVKPSAKSHFVMNYRKAGIFKFFFRKDGGRLVFGDNGYFLRNADGDVFSTQFLSAPEEIRSVFLYDSDCTGKIELDLPVRRVNYSLPLVHYDIPFALFSKTLGRIPSVGRLLEKAVKDIFIRKPAGSVYRLNRSIEITNEQVVIRDSLTGGSEKVTVLLGGESTAPHVPSSRYHVSSEPTAPAFRWTGILPLHVTIILDFKTGECLLKADRRQMAHPQTPGDQSIPQRP